MRHTLNVAANYRERDSERPSCGRVSEREAEERTAEAPHLSPTQMNNDHFFKCVRLVCVCEASGHHEQTAIGTAYNAFGSRKADHHPPLMLPYFV